MPSPNSTASPRPASRRSVWWFAAGSVTRSSGAPRPGACGRRWAWGPAPTPARTGCNYRPASASSNATKHGRRAEAGFTPVHDVFSVEGDLRADFAPGLLAAGFAPDQPCVWFAEGLLQYLEPPAVNALIHQVSALSADGSEFFFDVMHEEYANDPAHVRVAALMQELGVQISLAPADGPMRWLAGHGWTAVTYAETDLLVGACPLIPPLPARLAVDPRMIRYVHATNSPLSRHPAAAA